MKLPLSLKAEFEEMNPVLPQPRSQPFLFNFIDSYSTPSYFSSGEGLALGQQDKQFY